jgi:hypothetical protein
MIIRIALAASLLALAACQPAAAPTPDAAQPAGAEAPATQQPETAAANCDLTVERAWGPIGPSDHPSYRVKVWTTGAVCEASVVTLAVFARDGFPIYTWAGAAQYLFALRDAKNPTEMATALNEWIGPDNQPPELTGTLPPWEETDGQAKQTEFPFMPNMEKEAYEELRKANHHMLCYPQGIESSLCLALWQGQDGAPPMIEEIGLWRFPG